MRPNSTASEIKLKKPVRHEAIFETVIDIEKIDLKAAKEWIRDTFREIRNCPNYRIYREIVYYRLEEERYPDPISLQCELIYFGLDEDTTKKLMVELWHQLTREIESDRHPHKYRKLSTPQGTTKKVGSTHHYSGSHSHSSHDGYSRR